MWLFRTASSPAAISIKTHLEFGMFEWLVSANYSQLGKNQYPCPLLRTVRDQGLSAPNVQLKRDMQNKIKIATRVLKYVFSNNLSASYMTPRQDENQEQYAQSRTTSSVFPSGSSYCTYGICALALFPVQDSFASTLTINSENHSNLKAPKINAKIRV